MTDAKQIFLSAPDTQLDASLKPLIEKWSDPPSALQLLEVLDKCIRYALASGFVVSALQVMYDAQMKREGITHEEAIRSATWRGKP